MKKFLNIFSLLWIAGYSYAQTLNATTAENYVYTKTCLDADCIKKSEAIQYFDGLGRTKQTIGIKATPSGKDVVNHIEYDGFGRIAKEYLPIPQNTTQNGAFYSAPLANAPAVFGQEKIYSEKQFENSPLSRIDKITPLGNDWALHPVQMGYSANIAGEVKKYTVTNSWVDEATLSELIDNGTYGANQLMKTTVIDSDNNTSVEFKNTAGQTILVRKNDGTKDVDTYYVYNDLGMQVFVITPLAAAAPVDQTALNNLCYQYRYDSLGRLVEKKLPGKEWEYMVYDKADRLILSRDTSLKQSNQWLMTKYDEFGRPIYTGFLTGGDRAARQNDLKNIIIKEQRSPTGFLRNGTTVYYTENYFSGETPVILSINYYDTYPQGTPSKPASIFGQDIIGDNLSASQNTKNLPTASYVKNIDDDNWTYNWIWYDSKLRAVGSHSNNHLGGYTKTETKLDFAGVAMQSKAYHKRVQTDTERIISQTFEYDDQNRLLVQKHQIDNNPVEILSQNEYNERSQLKRKKVGGTMPASPLQTIDYTYNALGVLIKINDPVNLNGKLFGYGIKYTNPEYSNVGSGRYNGTITEIDWQNSSENVQKRYNYTYDKLNRLKDAIYSEPGSTTPFNNYYNEYLTYDLNGNIKSLKRNAFPVSGTTATQVDDLVYDYTGNRLTKVTENALNDTGYEGGNNTITYDANGNMKNMLDKGIQSISYNFLNLSDTFTIVQNAFGNPINNTLKYLYSADGTKYRKIYTTKTTGRAARTTIQTTDYLDGFQYTIEEGSTCLTCRTTSAYEQQAYKGISELGKVIAPQWKLDFVATAEGYYSFTENRYIYQYKDHLGNTRVSFAKDSAGDPEILDTNNYYPFGLNHIGNTFSPFGSFYSYKYNGKELQETGMYDYGARMYMPDLGRWGATDPLAEAFSQFSPYHYGANNPVMFIDPDGMRSVPTDGGIISNVPDGSYWFAGMNGNFTYTPEFKQGSRTGGGSGGSSVNLVNRILGLGGNWSNTGSGFSDSNNISLGYDGGYQSLNSNYAEGGIGEAVVNIPTVNVSGSFAIEFALQLRNHVNDYMAGFNAQSDLAWKKWTCPRCFDGPIQYIGSGGDPAGVFDIGGQVMSTWKPENRYLAMGAGILAAVALRKPGLAVKEAQMEVNVLRHYTTEAGYKAIMESGELLPSIGIKNARHGSGQYLTDLISEEFTKGQASRRLFGVPWNSKKLTHFIELNVKGLNVTKNGPHNFLVPGTGNLPLKGIIVNHGPSIFKP